MRTIIRGLDGLNLIGADIVEVSPAYDTNAELSTMYVAPGSGHSLYFLFFFIFFFDGC